MRVILFIFFSIVAVSLGHAQVRSFADSSDFWEDDHWEIILETAIQADENSPIAEETKQLEDNPLDINTASAEELHRIPGLSNLVVSRIIDRRKYKRFTSVDELIDIEGVTPELLSFIRGFVKIGKINRESNIDASFLSRTSTGIEERQGFINGTYPGSPVKELNRFSLSLNDIKSSLTSAVSKVEVGVLTEKDPGELSLTNFSTYFASFSVPSYDVRLITGDYQMEAAEGLIFWRSSAFGKGSDVIAPARKNGSGIHPHLSSDENSFFRGICASVGLYKVHLQVLYSNKAVNATIDSMGQISSIDESGLFRTDKRTTQTEFIKRDINRLSRICLSFRWIKDWRNLLQNSLCKSISIEWYKQRKCF